MKFGAFVTALAVFSISDLAASVPLVEECEVSCEYAQVDAFASSEAEKCNPCPCCDGTVYCCAPNGKPGGTGGKGGNGEKGRTGDMGEPGKIGESGNKGGKGPKGNDGPPGSQG